MKKITLFSILAAFVAALSLTSCNTDSDNDYSALSQESQKNYQAAMSMGAYNDMVIVFDKKNDANVNNQTDSVYSSVYVSMNNDSTMRITNFPVAALAEHITEQNLSAAIAKEAPRTITCKYFVLPNSTSDVAALYAWPTDIEMNLAYGADNKSHKVQLKFLPYQYPYGMCTLKEPRQMYLPFAFCELWVDGAKTGYLKNSTTSSSQTNQTVTFVIRNAWKKTGK